MTGEQKGISTRSMLVAALVLVIGCVTIASMLILHDRMRLKVLTQFSGDLTRSVSNFEENESERLAALGRENALLADLPSLKALMTTSDPRTIEDGALQFSKVGDNDLFALTNSAGEVMAVETRGAPAGPGLRQQISQALAANDRHFLLDGVKLYEYSVRPLYFGSADTGTLLGYVVSGYAVDDAFLARVHRSSAAEITFLAGGKIVASTLQPSLHPALEHDADSLTGLREGPVSLNLAGQEYLVESEDLAPASAAPLRLVAMKSFREAEKTQHEINLMLILVGLFALFAGTLLMFAISSMVTRPLEMLAKGVQAFGSGNSRSVLPTRGTLEVRELSISFAQMREQIQQTNHALVESERLATIGRMASSVSHDLRHYLSAVYANAEFLASSRLSPEERADLFVEITNAVHGTTELIDSLLIFSRSNGAIRRAPELVANLLARAVSLVQAHPDAARVALQITSGAPALTAAVVQAKQLERAIYNLLLNACQAARKGPGEAIVIAAIEGDEETVSVRITDTGPGIPDAVRSTLFEAFVSEGKQNGTGLGLTLAHAVAQEHGGAVLLVQSLPGETVFMLTIERGRLEWERSANQDATEVTP